MDRHTVPLTVEYVLLMLGGGGEGRGAECQYEIGAQQQLSDSLI